ncbi:MAG: OmpA family protein [Bacteroidales bacterium]|jgi:chemotaxis protein MotB|nr:OmpA family protein [Bacteroidales bacterium]
MKNFIIVMLAALVATSCVSSKKYNELLKQNEVCNKEVADLKKKNHKQETDITEITALRDRLQSEIAAAQTELDTLRRNYFVCKNELASLQDSYSKIDTKYKSSVSSNQQLSQDLLAKENALNALSEKLSTLAKELAEKEELLAEKEKKVAELQSILDTMQNKMRELKQRISDALIGFAGKGLTVHTKNGKVYVSVDEKLLFASGKWEVGAAGREALEQVGKALANNPDIQILVEGHTDNVPLKGKGDVKDNWDLSVMRATAIVKILLENPNVSPAQIEAGGRGEFSPVVDNSSSENRAKNRRSEIILTPKLDELYQLLGE